MSTPWAPPNRITPYQPRTEIVEIRGLRPSNQAHHTHRLDEASSSRTITSHHSPRITAEQITPPQVVQHSLRSRFADREASAWQTLELCALSLSKAHQAIEELTNNNNQMPQKAKRAIQAFVQIKQQRFRLREVKRHTDHFIRDEIRKGWQQDLDFVSYAQLDHVEEILNIVREPSEKRPHVVQPSSIQRLSAQTWPK